MWFPRNGNSRLFSELSYLTSISLKCKLCPMQSYDPWQVLTFATSAKVPPDQFLLIHSQVYLCLCYRHTTPKYPLWLIWGGGSFLTCSQSGKAASENSKSSREDLYRCTLPTGLRNPSWDQNAHRNERTTFLTSHWSTLELLRFNDILWQARYWVSERDQVAFMAYLLYIRISGFHSAEGGILTSSTLPYSLVFHAKLTSSHSCREIIFNQVEFMWKYFAETTHQI